MGVMSEANRRFAEHLIQETILEPVDDHRVDQSNGVIAVFCGDGGNSHDIFKYYTRKLCSGIMEDPRIHTVTLNGGALNAVPDSPLHLGLPVDQVLFTQVAGAVLLQGITQIVLEAHVDCGLACGVCGQTMEEICDDFVVAIRRSKEEIPQAINRIIQRVAPKFDHLSVPPLTFLPFLHLRWDVNARQTWFFNKKKYQKRQIRQGTRQLYTMLAEQFPGRVSNIPVLTNPMMNLTT